MTLPTIHLNGTSPERLRDGYTEARNAVQGALRVLEDAGPNARDYYPQGPDAYRFATVEHTARCKKLADISAEIEILEWHCQEAIDAREAQKR